MSHSPKVLIVLAYFTAPAVDRSHAEIVALVNSPTGNATFVSNFLAFVEGEGHSFVRNPTSFDGAGALSSASIGAILLGLSVIARRRAAGSGA